MNLGLGFFFVRGIWFKRSKLLRWSFLPRAFESDPRRSPGILARFLSSLQVLQRRMPSTWKIMKRLMCWKLNHLKVYINVSTKPIFLRFSLKSSTDSPIFSAASASTLWPPPAQAIDRATAITAQCRVMGLMAIRIKSATGSKRGAKKAGSSAPKKLSCWVVCWVHGFLECEMNFESE